MAVGDLLKVRTLAFHGTLGSAHVGINIMHFRIDAQTGLGCTLAEIALALDNTFAPGYIALMSANASWRGVGVQTILPAVSVEAVSIVNAAVGGVAGDLLAGQSGFIRKETALGGRQNLGRIYVPFPSEADNSAAGAPSAGYQVLLTALALLIGPGQVIIGAGGTATLTMALFHRSLGTSTPVTGFFESTDWATQRRRMLRGRARPIPF